MSTARHFDDLEVGLAETSPSRTVTAEDVAAFAALSGDHNPLHTDPVHAAASPFGQIVAHGLLVTAIASGLFTRTELSRSLQGAVVAMLGIDCRFEGPVVPGDTLTVAATVTELRPTRRPDRGIAVITRDLYNQRGERVQTATTPMLLARAHVPAAAAEGSPTP